MNKIFSILILIFILISCATPIKELSDEKTRNYSTAYDFLWNRAIKWFEGVPKFKIVSMDKEKGEINANVATGEVENGKITMNDRDDYLNLSDMLKEMNYNGKFTINFKRNENSKITNVKADLEQTLSHDSKILHFESNKRTETALLNYLEENFSKLENCQNIFESDKSANITSTKSLNGTWKVIYYWDLSKEYGIYMSDLTSLSFHESSPVTMNYVNKADGSKVNTRGRHEITDKGLELTFGNTKYICKYDGKDIIGKIVSTTDPSKKGYFWGQLEEK